MGAVCCRTDRTSAAASARLDPFEKLQRLALQQQTAPKWSSGTALAETVCAPPLSSAPVGTAVSSHSRTLLYSTLFPSELRTPSVLSSIRPMVPPRTLRCILALHRNAELWPHTPVRSIDSPDLQRPEVPAYISKRTRPPNPADTTRSTAFSQPTASAHYSPHTQPPSVGMADVAVGATATAFRVHTAFSGRGTAMPSLMEPLQSAAASDGVFDATGTSQVRMGARFRCCTGCAAACAVLVCRRRPMPTCAAHSRRYSDRPTDRTPLPLNYLRSTTLVGFRRATAQLCRNSIRCCVGTPAGACSDGAGLH